MLAITLHEAAHGYVANRLGDSTAKMLGRLSLNPIKHIDPIGTIVLPVAMILMSTGFVFGWAKPVPVNTRNLKDPRKDMAAVAVAGPLSNLLMAIGWTLIWKISFMLPESANWVANPMRLMGQAGLVVNLIFMVLNLLPIPPLDGGRVATGLLPPSLGVPLSRVEPFGVFIVVGLLFAGVLTAIMMPLVEGTTGFIELVTGL